MKISISKSVVFQNIEEEKVVLNLETNKYHSLNKSGLIIWDLIYKNKFITFNTLIEEMKNDYEIDNNSILDVKDYIQNLHSLKLITIEDD